MATLWNDVRDKVLASVSDCVLRTGPNGFEQVDCVQLLGLMPQVLEWCETDEGGCNLVFGNGWLLGVESLEHANELMTALRVRQMPSPKP